MSATLVVIMYNGQRLNDSLGNQVALFPLDYLYITQGENGSYSHKGSLAIDFIGTTARYPYYAPFDCKLVYTSGAGDYIYQSLDPVRWVNGDLDYVTMWIVHDNTLYTMPRQVLQGQLLGHTGTAGKVTGDHLHMEVAKGQYAGVFQNSYGTWMLRNQVSMTTLYSVQDTVIVNDLGYNWREYNGGVTPPPPITQKGLPIWLMAQKG